MSRKNDQGSAPIADSELARTIKILELLATGEVTQQAAADQLAWSSKTVYRLKNRVMAWPVEKIATLPKSVQNYLIDQNLRKNKRPNLATELEAFGTKQQCLSDLIKDQLDKHHDDLSVTAKNLIARFKYIKQVARKDLEEELIGEVVINNPSLPECDTYLLDALFSHMRSDIRQLNNKKGWSELTIGEIDKQLLDRLALRANQHKFLDTCNICRDLA